MILFKIIIETSFDKILILVNNSLKNGVFPQTIKQSHIIPIKKSKTSDQNILSNYRPISNISFLSKILEKSALTQLLDHLNCNNLFMKEQSAYKSNHSCETALIKITNDVLSVLNSSTNVVVIFLDFTAAFDTICHQHLLCKLNKQYGLVGNVLKWFESYITDRTFKVKIKDQMSQGTKLRFGVPQGSVMGPILFGLYTQDIKEILKKYDLNFHVFADDIQIYTTIEKNNDEDSKINNCLIDIKSWAERNFLKLNDKKTKFLQIKTKHSKISTDDFFITETEFKFESWVKNLGMIIDENLNFKKQINEVCRVGFFVIRQLWRIASKINSVALKIQLVHACILSKIDYGNSLYIDLPQKEIKKLQRLLNAAVRFIFHITERKTRITPFLKKAHILPVHLRIKFKILVMVYKCTNKMAPGYLSETVEVKKSLESLRISKDTSLLKIPHLESQNYKNRRFEITAPRLWNTLPKSLRDSGTLSIFKSELKTFLFNQF